MSTERSLLRPRRAWDHTATSIHFTALCVFRSEADAAALAARKRERGLVMPIVEREIIIRCPVETVFDFVADGRNEPRYNPDSIRSEQLTAGKIGRGAQFRGTGRMMGRESSVVYELVA